MKQLLLVFMLCLSSCEYEYEVHIKSRDTDQAEIRRKGDGKNSWRKVYVPYQSGKLSSWRGKDVWYVRKTTELGTLNVSLIRYGVSLLSIDGSQQVDKVIITAAFDSASVKD